MVSGSLFGMRITQGQMAYREFLASPRWRQIRDLAINRDHGRCVSCGCCSGIQVHHKVYRKGSWGNVQLEDLVSLCAKCHAKEHGIDWDDLASPEFVDKCREIETHFAYGRRPPVSDWLQLKSMMAGTNEEIEYFAEVMLRYVFDLRSHEVEGFVTDWWMIEGKSMGWLRRARKVKKMIMERMKL